MSGRVVFGTTYCKGHCTINDPQDKYGVICNTCTNKILPGGFDMNVLKYKKHCCCQVPEYTRETEEDWDTLALKNKIYDLESIKDENNDPICHGCGIGGAWFDEKDPDRIGELIRSSFKKVVFDLTPAENLQFEFPDLNNKTNI
jgi:hypothetical protein